MRRLLRIRGLSHDCKKVRLTLLFEDGRLLNPEAAARSSMVGWGPWQTQAKVQTKWGPAWYVTTAGHGGYLLVTQTKDVPESFPGPAFAIEDEGRQAFVFEFEEDCNWAILEYLDDHVREWSGKTLHQGRLTPDTQWEHIVRILREYQPSILPGCEDTKA